MLINNLKNYLLRDTELVFPSYVFDTQEEYNPATSIPSTGLVSKTVFNSAMGIRTYSPIHNHIFINSSVDPVTLNYIVLGPGTDFQRFYDENYRILLFSGILERLVPIYTMSNSSLVCHIGNKLQSPGN